MLGYEHEATTQRLGTRVTLETLVGGVPMLVLVCDLALLDAYGLATRRAILHVNLLETLAAVRARRFHEVALAAEQLVAVEAGKVSHVPGTTFGLGALIREDYLVTGGAPRLEQLGMVASAVNLRVSSVKKVDQVDEKLAACGTSKTAWVPAGLGAGARCKYANCAVLYRLFTLLMLI